MAQETGVRKTAVWRTAAHETEFLNVKKHTVREIEEMIIAGEFQQAVHITAWLLSRRSGTDEDGGGDP